MVKVGQVVTVFLIFNVNVSVNVIYKLRIFLVLYLFTTIYVSQKWENDIKSKPST